MKLARETQTSLACDEAPAIVVPLLVTFILDHLKSQPELRRLLHVAAFELPAADSMIREHLGPIFDMVCAYFQRCVEKGTLRPVTPSLATLGLIGAITAHQSWCGWLADNEMEQDSLAAYATVWLNGLLP